MIYKRSSSSFEKEPASGMHLGGGESLEENQPYRWQEWRLHLYVAPGQNQKQKLTPPRLTMSEKETRKTKSRKRIGAKRLSRELD